MADERTAFRDYLVSKGVSEEKIRSASPDFIRASFARWKAQGGGAAESPEMPETPVSAATKMSQSEAAARGAAEGFMPGFHAFNALGSSIGEAVASRPRRIYVPSRGGTSDVQTISVPSDVPRPQGFTDALPAEVDASLGKYHQAIEEHPGTTLGAGVGGALAGGVGGGATRAAEFLAGKATAPLVRAGLPATGRLAKNMATGAAMGGAQAAAVGDDPSLGAGIGAGVGVPVAALGTAAAGVASRLRGDTGQLAQDIRAVERMPGGKVGLPGEGISGVPDADVSTATAGRDLGGTPYNRQSADMIGEAGRAQRTRFGDEWTAAVGKHLGDMTTPDQSATLFTSLRKKIAANLDESGQPIDQTRDAALHRVADRLAVTAPDGHVVGFRPFSVDSLRKHVRELADKAEEGMPQTGENAPYRAAARDMREAVGDVAPQVKAANDKYAADMKWLEQINAKVFGSEEAAMPAGLSPEQVGEMHRTRAAGRMGKFGTQSLPGASEGSKQDVARLLEAEEMARAVPGDLSSTLSERLAGAEALGARENLERVVSPRVLFGTSGTPSLYTNLWQLGEFAKGRVLYPGARGVGESQAPLLNPLIRAALIEMEQRRGR